MDARQIATACSQLSVKSQSVLPAEALERLGVGPGDRLRYALPPESVRLEKAPNSVDDSFVSFSEWAGAIDEEDYADL